MTELLRTQHCVACRRDSPKATPEEIVAFMPQIPDWTPVERGEQRLERVYPFKNFAQALAFTDQVGALAEAEGHHPAILTEWGKVTVAWWTHKIGGLHRNDLIMAAKCDEIYERMPHT